MQTPGFDPGLTRQFTAPLSRIINKDGSFNVHRRGETWHDFHPYLHLINMSWGRFFLTLFAVYMAVNLLFAWAYYALGPGELTGVDTSNGAARFLGGFFFSTHTLSTVGYGSISPHGLGANILASLESMIGVMAFAVATGLLYGRVSRPSARFGFSRNLLITRYGDGESLQFRVVNRRQNSLTELEVQVMLSTVQPENGQMKHRYELLNLERRSIIFLPLTWTVVHPIRHHQPSNTSRKVGVVGAPVRYVLLQRHVFPEWAFTFLSRMISLLRAAEERNSTLAKFRSRFFRCSFSTRREQLVAQLLDVGGVDDLAVEEADHRYFAGTAAEIRDFNSTIDCHQLVKAARPADDRACSRETEKNPKNTSLPYERAIATRTRQVTGTLRVP